MKKITLLLILCIGISFNSYAQFPETFDTEIPSTWAIFPGTNAEGPTYTWVHNANGYILCQWEAAGAGLTAEDWLVSPLVSITTANSLLTFDQTDYFALDYGSSYTVRISTTSQTDISTFTVVDTQAETSVQNGAELQFSGYSVDLSAYEGMSVYIAFVLEQNNGDAWFLDNIDLENQNATPPDTVTTPTPTHMEMDVNIDAANTNSVALAWVPATTGDPATGYKVAFGTDPASIPVLGTIGNPMVSITNSNYSTTYYWQITPTNAGGDGTPSPIWEFTTMEDPSLSTEDFDVNNTISHFYNTDTNDLTFKSSTSAFNNLDVYSILGQQVLNKKLSNATETINISNLTSGIYIAKISIDEKTETIKFVKK